MIDYVESNKENFVIQVNTMYDTYKGCVSKGRHKVYAHIPIEVFKNN